MKTKVRTILHLTDSKGWEKEIDWPQDNPPRTYRMLRRPKMPNLIVEETPDIPLMKEDNVIEFIWRKDVAIAINDKFFDHHIFYEENW